MRKIKINKWKVLTKEGNQVDESLLTALNALIAGKRPDEIPRGIDKYRLFGRLAKAFDNADKDGILVLEEADYSFIRKTIDADIPSTWAFGKDLSEAINSFLDAKEE